MPSRQLPTDRATLEQLADLVHHDPTWSAAARSLGCTVAAARRHYRPRLATYLRRRCVRDGLTHGTGRCAARCRHELCAAERAAQKAAWKAEAAGQVPTPAPSPAELDTVAADLHSGAMSLRAFAVSLGRTPTWVRQQWLPLLHDRLVAAAEADRPTGRHGTRSGYVGDGCRCLPCGDANRRYEAGRAGDTARGRPRTGPAPTVAAHALVEAAGSVRHAATAAGVSRGTLRRAVEGRCITTTSATAILTADTPSPLLVPASATRQVLTRLRRAGWDRGAIADALVVDRFRVRHRSCRTDRHQALAALLDRDVPTVDAAELVQAMSALAFYDVTPTTVASVLDVDVATLTATPPATVPSRLVADVADILAGVVRDRVLAAARPGASRWPSP